LTPINEYKVKWAVEILNNFIPVTKRDNEYYVCNKDEPYSKEVIDIILNGENQKQCGKTLYYLTKDFTTPLSTYKKGCSYLPHIWATILGLPDVNSFYKIKEFSIWFRKDDKYEK